MIKIRRKSYNKNTRIKVAVAEVKIDEINDEIKELKGMIEKFGNKLDSTCNFMTRTDKEVAVLKETLINHLQVHKEDMIKLGIVITIISTIVGWLLKFV